MNNLNIPNPIIVTMSFYFMVAIQQKTQTLLTSQISAIALTHEMRTNT